MSSVFFEISTSLDGYVAGPNPTLDEPLGQGGEKLHEWITELAAWRRAHGHEGGEGGPESDRMEDSLRRVGAVVMGRRMFSGGAGPWEDDPKAAGWWGEEPPFGVPVFVVTHHARESLQAGRTTFTFVTDGVEAALEQARAAARDRDVSVAGGASVGRQLLEAGLVDELRLHVAPVLLGGGTRLFEAADTGRIRLEQIEARGPESGTVAHLTYRVL